MYSIEKAMAKAASVDAIGNVTLDLLDMLEQGKKIGYTKKFWQYDEWKCNRIERKINSTIIPRLVTGKLLWEKLKRAAQAKDTNSDSLQ